MHYSDYTILIHNVLQTPYTVRYHRSNCLRLPSRSWSVAVGFGAKTSLTRAKRTASSSMANNCLWTSDSGKWGRTSSQLSMTLSRWRVMLRTWPYVQEVNLHCAMARPMSTLQGRTGKQRTGT
eukprot:1972908-Amphidinium_carterae.1